MRSIVTNDGILITLAAQSGGDVIMTLDPCRSGGRIDRLILSQSDLRVLRDDLEAEAAEAVELGIT